MSRRRENRGLPLGSQGFTAKLSKTPSSSPWANNREIVYPSWGPDGGGGGGGVRRKPGFSTSFATGGAVVDLDLRRCAGSASASQLGPSRNFR